MNPENTIQRPEYELLENGDVVRNVKGRPSVLAHYEEEDGHLEFVSVYMDERYRIQVQRAITEDTEGMASNKRILSYGIKGRERDEVKTNEPQRPKADRMLGDKTPAVVDWFFKWRPKEAYVRYGVQLNTATNEPVIAHCRRVELRIGENPKDGTVQQTEAVTENKEGIIARRATHRTFLKEEIVGADQGEIPVEAQD